MKFSFSPAAALLCLALSFTGCAQAADTHEAAFSKPEALIITDVQKRAFQLGSNLLSKQHYRGNSLRQISAGVFDNYLDTLDFNRIYFLKSDIEELSVHRSTLAQTVRKADLSPAVQIFERYRERASALNAWILQRLNQPFDLDGTATVHIPNNLRLGSSHLPWRETLEEVHAYQEARLTDTLIRLRMGGRSQEEAIKKLISRYEMQQKSLNQMTVEDVFDMYMNNIALRFDPHSSYLSPRSTEDFDINMSLSLEGIGATLSYEDGKITVRELVAGGPAFKSGKLRINDRIIGVAQDKDGEMQPVIGMRLDKAVRLIRGKKGTIVRLLIEPASPNMPETEIALERDTIKLEDQAAQGYVESVEANGITRKIGVIRLPSFYMDFEGARKGKENYRSTSNDLSNIIKNMKAQQIDGMILDLRGNGGGSLYEAVRTVGLFIDEGPVVMVSDVENSAETQHDSDKGALYEGPLAVMVDHGSASASEIFAAAIQDYRRGIVVGSNSFGKGTVQTVIALNRFVSSKVPPLGEMKITIAMFHRITGESTQHKGVVPDIALPTSADIEKVGERSLPYALPLKSIKAADYQSSDEVTPETVSALQRQHEQRMHSKPALLRYQEYINREIAEKERNEWSLNLAQREQQYQDWKSYVENYAGIQTQEMPALQSDQKRRKDIEKRNAVIDSEADKEYFVPDAGLFETLYILFDFIEHAHGGQVLDKAA